MKTTTKALVNIKKLSNTKDVQFKNFTTTLSVNWVDVYFKGQRIAIINGLLSPLQWTAENGSNIPLSIIDKIENYCMKYAV